MRASPCLFLFSGLEPDPGPGPGLYPGLDRNPGPDFDSGSDCFRTCSGSVAVFAEGRCLTDLLADRDFEFENAVAKHSGQPGPAHPVQMRRHQTQAQDQAELQLFVD